MNQFQKSQSERILSCYTQEDSLEKGGKKAFIGEVRNYGGQDWVKHHDGWVLVHPSGKHLLERPGGKREPASKEHIDHAVFHLGKGVEEVKRERSSPIDPETHDALVQLIGDMDANNSKHGKIKPESIVEVMEDLDSENPDYETAVNLADTYILNDRVVPGGEDRTLNSEHAYKIIDKVRSLIVNDEKPELTPVPTPDNSTIHSKIQSMKEKIERVAREYKGNLPQDKLKEHLAQHAVDKYIVDVYHTNYKEGDDFQEIYDRLGPAIYKELGVGHEKYNSMEDSGTPTAELAPVPEPTIEEVKDAIPSEKVLVELSPMAQRFLDAVRIADYDIQLSELSVSASDKGNWFVFREGEEGKLMTVRGDLLDDQTIMDYDLQHYHVDEDFVDEPVKEEIKPEPIKDPSSQKELDYIDTILPEEKDIERAKGIDSDAKASSMANKINDREKLVRRAKAVAMHSPQFFSGFENSLLASGFKEDQIAKIKGSTAGSDVWVPKERTTPVKDSRQWGGREYGRRSSSILPLGSINLKTGESKYFNVFSEWGEDTTYEVYEVKDSDGKVKHKLVATSGKRPIYDVGDRNHFEHDQTFAPMFEGIVVDYAVGAKELKKLASVYGNSMYGYTYK